MKPALVVVGLGNPGPQYEDTRHNLGFWAAERLAEEFGEGDWCDMQKFESVGAEARILTFPVLILKPTTYMNLSVNAVRKVVDFYKLDPATQVLVLTDDIDIPLGELRLREKGGPGTHNGLKSINVVYGEEFPRLRIGLGAQPPGADLAAWLLSKISAEERDELTPSIDKIPQMVREFILGDDA